MKVFLSGMPELRLGVNDKLRLEPNGSELLNPARNRSSKPEYVLERTSVTL